MADVPTSGGYDVLALIAALTANVTALLKGRGVTQHSVNNTVHAAVAPVSTRVTKVEQAQSDTATRLDRIEDTIAQNHRDVTGRLDRLLERRDAR